MSRKRFCASEFRSEREFVLSGSQCVPNKPCQFHVTCHKRLVDTLLHKYPASGEAHLPLVHKSGSDGRWQALVQVSTLKDNTGVLSTKLHHHEVQGWGVRSRVEECTHCDTPWMATMCCGVRLSGWGGWDSGAHSQCGGFVSGGWSMEK